MVDLIKPTKITPEPYWDYREVINYIEKKYNIKTDEYIPKNGFTLEQLEARSSYDKENNRKPYLCFWHWIIDHYGVHNGSSFTLYYDDIDDENTPDWVQEILKMIFDEFEPDYAEMEMYVSW
jgi:hypothetical protein